MLLLALVLVFSAIYIRLLNPSETEA
jgi:hypothetical protein